MRENAIKRRAEFASHQLADGDVELRGSSSAPGDSAGAAPSLVQGAADTALYEAKHRGGGCTVIRGLALVEPAFTVEAGSGRSASFPG